ncbi:AcrR family transcriptional regulator [Kitasatospora sp. MAA4]|uniref:TetR/AcrR family transcriptional regulator n=1 Tax=Kitasatospora sp. MAA4 TaxID=3035093 RepID=UPI0024753DEC|nr:TetR/AcrR family transcriptional regulator [Kitasatospora sp. MAA4]MDH6133721.1 AcrR family transcriptional regulator [Kitasatospora sp. MAA4]
MTQIPNPDLRNQRARRAILDAALELAVRDGYAKLTVEAIATAAGVGKQTIYRWWPGKAAVLLEAFNDRTGSARELPDTGDIAADITASTQAVIRLLDTDLGTVWRALLAEAQTDPRFAEELRSTFFEPRNQCWQERFEAAVTAGQLRADIPTRTMIEMLFGPVYYRLLIGATPLDPDDTARIDYFLNGLKARS